MAVPKIIPAIIPAITPGTILGTIAVREANAAPRATITIDLATGHVVSADRAGLANAPAHAARLARMASGGRPLLIPYMVKRVVHRAGLTNLTRERALALCNKLRAFGDFCLVRPPSVMKELMKRALRASRGQSAYCTDIVLEIISRFRHC
jgi:hypothetical protein